MPPHARSPPPSPLPLTRWRMELNGGKCLGSWHAPCIHTAEWRDTIINVRAKNLQKRLGLPGSTTCVVRRSTTCSLDMAASNTRRRRTCGVAEGPCALRHWSASHSPQARTYTSTIPSSTRFRLLFLLALQTVSSLLPCLHFWPIYLILHAFRVLLCLLHALPPHPFDLTRMPSP